MSTVNADLSSSTAIPAAALDSPSTPNPTPKANSLEDAAEFELLPVGCIVPSPYNSREVFSGEAWEEFCFDVRARGVLTPVSVRPIQLADHFHVEALAMMPNGAELVPVTELGRAILEHSNPPFLSGFADKEAAQQYLDNAPTHYELVAGERRWRASIVAGHIYIRALVEEMTDRQLLEAQIVENLHRADLSPVEEARHLATLLEQIEDDEPDIGRREAIERVGTIVHKSRRTILERLQILNLVPEALAQVEQGNIGASAAARLMAKPEEEQRRVAADAAEGKQVKVRDVKPSGAEYHNNRETRAELSRLLWAGKGGKLDAVTAQLCNRVLGLNDEYGFGGRLSPVHCTRVIQDIASKMIRAGVQSASADELGTAFCSHVERCEKENAPKSPAPLGNADYKKAALADAKVLHAILERTVSGSWEPFVTVVKAIIPACELSIEALDFIASRFGFLPRGEEAADEWLLGNFCREVKKHVGEHVWLFRFLVALVVGEAVGDHEGLDLRFGRRDMDQLAFRMNLNPVALRAGESKISAPSPKKPAPAKPAPKAPAKVASKPAVKKTAKVVSKVAPKLPTAKTASKPAKKKAKGGLR